MPTLLNLEGFKFFFYANEQEPKHIHPTKGGDFAKIELGTFRVVHCTLKSQEIRRALEITSENQTEFLRKWDEYFSHR